MVLYGPAFRFGRYEETPKMLVVDGDRVVCLDERRSGVERTELSLTDVHTAEWGSALLHSWLRLDATSDRGPASIQVDFNSICGDLYRPVLHEYRGLLYANERMRLRGARSSWHRRSKASPTAGRLRAWIRPSTEPRRST